MPRGPVRSVEQLTEDMAKLIQELGALPTQADVIKRAKMNQMATAATYISRFGSWNQALKVGATSTGRGDLIKQEITHVVTWKETPKEERAKQLAEQRTQAEADGTSRESQLINLFGAKIIFGREVTSSSTKSLDSEGEAFICGSELKPIREGRDNTNGLLKHVGGTSLWRRELTVKVLKDGELEDFPPERPHVFYIVSRSVATELLSAGRRDIVYPRAYGSGGNRIIVCREIVIP